MPIIAWLDNLRGTNWFFYSSLSLCLANIFLLVLLLNYGKTEVHKRLSVFYIFLLIWGFFSLLASITLDPLRSLTYWKLGCAGVCFTSVLSLQVTNCVIKKRALLITILSYSQAIFFSLALILTDWVISPPLNISFRNFLVPTPGPLYYYWFFGWTIVLIFGHGMLLRERNHNSKTLPLSFKEMALFFASGFASGVFNFLNPFNFYAFQFANFGIAIYVLLLTYFLVRNQNIPLESAYKKGLLYSTIAGIISGFYIISAHAAESFFKDLFGYNSFMFTVIFTFVIALVFDPIRKVVHGFVDKIFLGKMPEEAIKENELLRQELERSERLKAISTLALGLAHEIRNPLTTIKTFAQFLPKKYHERDFVDKFSRLISDEVDRINDIVTKLLDFSKPTVPRAELISAGSYISDITNLMNGELLKKHIYLRESSIDLKLKIYADPNQFKQVIWNLVMNAMQAMPNGGSLDISAYKTNDRFAVIELADTGTGIPEDKIKHVFDPFYTTKDEGAGLGLAIVHQIVKSHGGKIQIESALNKGTIFRIFWPMKQT